MYGIEYIEKGRNIAITVKSQSSDFSSFYALLNAPANYQDPRTCYMLNPATQYNISK